jgi:hypothetical protein
MYPVSCLIGQRPCENTWEEVRAGSAVTTCIALHFALQSLNVHGANRTHGTGGVVGGVDRVVVAEQGLQKKVVGSWWRVAAGGPPTLNELIPAGMRQQDDNQSPPLRPERCTSGFTAPHDTGGNLHKIAEPCQSAGLT